MGKNTILVVIALSILTKEQTKKAEIAVYACRMTGAGRNSNAIIFYTHIAGIRFVEVGTNALYVGKIAILALQTHTIKRLLPLKTLK